MSLPGVRGLMGGRGRAPEVRRIGAQERSELGMKAPRNEGLGSLRCGGSRTQDRGDQESGARSQCASVWGPGKVTIGAQYPQVGDPSHKSPHTHPGLACPGGGRGGGAKFSELRTRGKTSQAGARQDPEPESELEPQRRPLPFPRPRPCSLPWSQGPGGHGTPPPRGEGQGGRGARAHVFLSSSSAPSRQPEPLPSRPGPPAPPPPRSPFPRSGQWPRRLDTPSPPGRPRAFFARQSGTGGGSWAEAAGAHTPKGGLAGGRGTLAERPWPGVPGSRCGARRWEGRACTAQPRSDRAGSGRSCRPRRASAHTHGLSHTRRHTEPWVTHADGDVHTHTHTHYTGRVDTQLTH